jgi:hypothetical protein
MNILWIEDFDGLSSGTDTLESMFKNLLSFNDWEEDELNLIIRPTDLKKFCEQQKSVHQIYLCRNYSDYIDFKENSLIINKIDVAIIDIDLNNRNKNYNFSAKIPDGHSEEEFHKKAGFYIFNDLIHLGVPAELMRFMTAQDNSLDDFKKDCIKNYMPPVEGFIKGKDYEELRDWLTLQQSSYAILRRGIIEGCRCIANLIKNEEKDDKDRKAKEEQLTKDYLRFNNYIEKSEKKVSLDDMRDYLKVLENFLPLRKPNDKAALYKLFVRTLAHEWDAAEPKQLNKQNKQNGLYAFTWIMKMSRNWLAHGKIFEQLKAQDVAYLFIVNMRAMFDLGDNLLVYEKHLLNLFANEVLPEKMKEKIGDNPSLKKDNKNYKQREIPLAKNYAILLDKNGKAFQAVNFHDALNNFQKESEKDNDFFIKGLFQTFWFLTSSGYVYIPSDKDKVHDDLKYQFKYFDYHKDSQDYLFELARHIYNYSFTEV